MSIVKNLCKFILTRGPRVGHECLKKNCKVHLKKLNMPKNYFELDSLPLELLDIIFSYFKDNFWTIQSASFTCKTLHRIAQPYFKLYYNFQCENIIKDIINYREECMNHYNLSYMQKICLNMYSHCQRCNINLGSNKKIFFPLPFMLCHNCMKKITISDIELRKDYNINPEDLNLRFYTVNQYIYLYGTLKVKFYIKSEINKQTMFNVY